MPEINTVEAQHAFVGNTLDLLGIRGRHDIQGIPTTHIAGSTTRPVPRLLLLLSPTNRGGRHALRGARQSSVNGTGAGCRHSCLVPPGVCHARSSRGLFSACVVRLAGRRQQRFSPAISVSLGRRRFGAAACWPGTASRPNVCVAMCQHACMCMLYGLLRLGRCGTSNEGGLRGAWPTCTHSMLLHPNTMHMDGHASRKNMYAMPVLRGPCHVLAPVA